MGTERHRQSSSKTPYFATHRNQEEYVSERVTRHERPPSPTDSNLSGSTKDLNDAEGIKLRNGIPTIAISDPGDDRSPETSLFKTTDDRSTSPQFDLHGRTLSPSRHGREGFPRSKLSALKKKTYHVLSFGHEKGEKSRKTRSPPIVDFTRFEDRYRSPSSDYDTLLSVSKGKKNDNERKAMSLFSSNRNGKPGNVFANKTWKKCVNTDTGCGNSGRVQTVGNNEMERDLSDRSVLYPANERKPDPRLIMDAIENASELVDIQGLLNVDDLLRTYDADQEDFELRVIEGETGRKSRSGKTRTVFGESIQNVFRYASARIILGEKEYILPIVVLHCVEEVYRTGIYQSNLFRTLPNRPRLHELISIFDSEEQPPGSIIRSRQSSSDLEGFGAATSLHLESTPDICALLASYLSALPESIVSPNLFEAIWKLCEVDKQPHNDFPEPQPAPNSSPESSAPVRLSSIPLARSYTPRCEANYILIAQLLLHLLPSSHFFLFVYLLSFFSQVALVREENGVGFEDLSKMFGARIFGHGDNNTSSINSRDLQQSSMSSKAKGKEKEGNGRGEVMMVWFLRRWGPLSESLFEVVDDAKLGVLHRNKLMRKDSLGKAAITAYTAACESIGAHVAVESEVDDEQKEGEIDDEVENLIEREPLEGRDVDSPEPMQTVGTPISSPVTFARKGLNLLSLPEGNTNLSRKIAGGPKDSPQSSSVSLGSSSSSLPPYTARPSRNIIEAEFNPTATRLSQNERPDTHLGDGIPYDTDHYHSTPKKCNVDERMLDFMNGSIGNTNHSDEKSCPSRVMTPQKDEGSGIIGVIDRSIEDEDGSSTHSLSSLHERLLDVSMPISIFDFDETLPVTTIVGNNPPNLFPSTPISVTLAPHPGVVGRNLTQSRIPSTTELKRHITAFSNSPSGTLHLPPGSTRRRSSIPKNEFLSPLPTPPMPTKGSELAHARSQPRLPGFQNQPQSPSVLAIRKYSREKDTKENDAVINTLRERLIEVEKERDEARRIVTEVRMALWSADDGSLHTLLS